MKRKILASFVALAGLISICAPSARGMWDFDRHWIGHQRPTEDGGGREDRHDREEAQEAAREEARQKARQEQYDGYQRQEDAALKNGNYREALRFALQKQAMWDGPNVRSTIALCRGMLAKEGGDYQAALAYLREASKNPGLAEFANYHIKQTEGEQKGEAARAAVRDLNGVARGGSGPPAPVAGLEFMETSPGAFGTRVAQPVLKADPGKTGATAGTDTSAADQLKSAEYHGGEAKLLLPPDPKGALEPSSGDARKEFDTAGENRGHLGVSAIETPPGSAPMPVIPPEMVNDPIIREDVKHLTDWNQQLQKANEEVRRAQDAVNKAQDPGAKAMAVITLNSAKSKSEGLYTAVESAKKDIETRKVYLAPFRVGGPSSVPQQQPSGTAPVPQPGS